MEVKWSQWSPNGMIRCGRNDFNKEMEWMVQLGRDAKQCVMKSDKQHAVYGRIMRDESDEIIEVRFYSDVYLDDNELDVVARHNPHDTMYVAHK